MAARWPVDQILEFVRTCKWHRRAPLSVTDLAPAGCLGGVGLLGRLFLRDATSSAEWSNASKARVRDGTDIKKRSLVCVGRGCKQVREPTAFLEEARWWSEC